jgi:hypothetical protein
MPVEPVVLAVEAFVEDDYRVRISPVYWTIPESASALKSLTKTFRVREFFAREVSTTAVTRVSAISENVKVKVREMGNWRVGGWRGPGYSRDTVLVLEIPSPEEVGDTPIELLFEHVGTAGKAETIQKARLALLVRRL